VCKGGSEGGNKKDGRKWVKRRKKVKNKGGRKMWRKAKNVKGWSRRRKKERGRKGEKRRNEEGVKEGGIYGGKQRV
jgi:hypothetical protein